MFVLQVAIVKGRGGIATAIGHYERMFRAVGVRSAILFRGPSFDALRAEGADMIAAPGLMTSPLAGFTPMIGAIREAVLARAAGGPIVILVHSDRTLPALRRMFPGARIVTPCHSDKFKHKAGADLVITLNDEQHRLVQAALPRTRVREMGNPFAPIPGAPGPNWQTPPSGRLRVNFLGRLEGFKDPMTMVRAFMLANLPAHAEMRVIGAGPLDAELRAAAASTLRPIEFVGWLDAPFAHFEQGDLLVLPSTWESYSYVVREALHHGVPIVASDIMVHRDALGDGAFGALFPAGDAEGLAHVMETALTDLAGLKAKAEQGREVLMSRYGAEPFWRELSSEIQQIAARTSASPEARS